eukprot:scaffold58982_cov59-Phaeocystis_antarctica.AAC.4
MRRALPTSCAPCSSTSPCAATAASHTRSPSRLSSRRAQRGCARTLRACASTRVGSTGARTSARCSRARTRDRPSRD